MHMDISSKSLSFGWIHHRFDRRHAELGIKGQRTRGAKEGANLYMSLNARGHITSILYDGTPALVNSGGVLGPPPNCYG